MATTTIESRTTAANARTTFGEEGRRHTNAFQKKVLSIALWIIQALLALLFLFAGGTKLVLPLDVLASMGSPNQVQLPGLFIRFIGVAEVLGAFGLILPGLLRIRRGLTPLAAAGLVIIMIGATVLTLASGDGAAAFVPAAIGLLSALVVYGRLKLERS